MSIIEIVGTFAALAALLSVGGLLCKHFVIFYWEESAAGRVVDFADLLLSLQQPLQSAYQFLLKEIAGTLAASVTFFVLARTPSISFVASIGYATLVFLVAAVLAPRVIRGIVAARTPAEQKSPGQQ